MTFERVVDAYNRFLGAGSDPDQARQAILDFLEWEEPDEELFAQDVRIVLMAANFSKELTTAVMWLNERDLDIRCIRVIPYHDQGRTLVDVQQVIPLPEAAQYQIHLREKEQRGRKERSERYDIRRRFWAGLLKRADGKTRLHSNISPSEYPWIAAGSGMRGVTYQYLIRQHDATAELYIDKGEANTNKMIFDELESHKDHIEQVFGAPLLWHRMDAKRGCRISCEIQIGGYRDDEAKWPLIQDAMVDAMVRLEKTFSPYIESLRQVGRR
jgi:hypothetical protein